MLSFPQDLKITESEVRKIREAMDLENKTREMEAAKAKEMQVAFKQDSTRILSQVLKSTTKATQLPLFFSVLVCLQIKLLNFLQRGCVPSSRRHLLRLFFTFNLQCLIELTGLAAQSYTATCVSGSNGSEHCASSCTCIK